MNMRCTVRAVILIIFVMMILSVWDKPVFAIENLRQTKEGKTTATIA